MIIIGIAGGISHGKTTLAEDFIQIEPKSVHLEMSELISEVVNVWKSKTISYPTTDNLAEINDWIALLPPILKKILHVEVNSKELFFDDRAVENNPHLYEKLFVFLKMLNDKPVLISQKITPKNKAQYRSILQWLGGYIQVKLPPGVWFRELILRARESEKRGIQLCLISGVRFPADIEVIHEGNGKVILVDRPLERELETGDLTESIRSQLVPDIVLSNNAGLHELKKCAKQIYMDLQNFSLQKTYQAKDFQ